MTAKGFGTHLDTAGFAARDGFHFTSSVSCKLSVMQGVSAPAVPTAKVFPQGSCKLALSTHMFAPNFGTVVIQNTISAMQ